MLYVIKSKYKIKYYNTKKNLERDNINKNFLDDSINKNGCSFEHINSKHILNVDRKLRLAFCQPVTQLFKTKCAGRRGLLRVIGQVDIKLRETISSVNDTLVFCRCDPPMELKLIAIEPWLDKHAFVYRCLRS